MNIVLYTRQLEPLTIFNLPMEWIEYGRRNRFVAVAIPPKLADFAHSITDEPTQNYTKQVRLTFERLRMGNVEADIVLVDDDVTALLLPTGQAATITEKGTEDAHEWGDRQGWRMAYRVRYDDNTVAQFPAAWLDRTAEPAQ